MIKSVTLGEFGQRSAFGIRCVVAAGFERQSRLLCDRDTAAVASARAGQLYGLNALDESIQDNKNNITRFLVLSRDPRVQASSSQLQANSCC